MFVRLFRIKYNSIFDKSSGTRHVCVCYCVKQVDSMMQWVCSVIDHRRRQNVVKTPILTSSVVYY